MGKWNVKRSVRIRDGFGNMSEIDITYGVLRRYPPATCPTIRALVNYVRSRYIECKAYNSEHLVPLSDVAKFKEVLQLNGISPRKGYFITTSDYVPRAKVRRLS